MRYSWSQATLNRMLRATERAGLSVSCVEITRDGNITVRTQPPVPDQSTGARGETPERPRP
jgi:hypothetical protein